MHILTRASMKNRALIALVTIVVAIFGGLALTNLKQELAPSVQFPQLAILTVYPGAAPEVVNQDVSVPIETAVQGVPGIESTTATSSTNLSLISASFTYGTDLITAEQKINQAINRIKSTLPEDIDPQVISGSFDDFPVLQIGVSSDLTALELSDLIRSSTLAEIKDIEGVRDAALVGAPEERVTITPDQAALQAEGLNTGDIKDTLDANGLLIPAGEITEDGKTLSVQVGEKITTVDEIAALPLVGATGPDVVTIGDVSTVAMSPAPTTTLSRVNGESAVTIAVTKLPGANTVDVSHAVNDALPALADSLGNGATFTVVFDQAPYIEKSIESLTTEGLLGLLFAVIIILIFLMSIRSTLVTAISIPTSVLITFIGLQTANYTLNILTLGALTIAIGRVVDDSIVVIENIKRHLVAGSDRAKVIVDAVKEVAGAITASTATTVAVFLPLAFVGDITGELFRPFALTVTIALVASLVVSLTIVPVLAYWFLRPPKETKRNAEAVKEAATTGEERQGRLQKSYLPIIRWTLKHAVVTIILAVLVLAGTVAITPLMKTNFLGSSGQNTFTVNQAIEPGTSLDEQDALASDVEEALLDTEGVTIVQVSIGSSGNALRDAFIGGGDTAITYSVTTDENADQQVVQDAAIANVEKVADPDTITLSASSGFGASGDIKVNITAPSQETLDEATLQVEQAMKDLPEAKQVTSNLSEVRPYIAVSVKRSDAAAAGFSEVALAGFVAQAMRPTQVGTVVIEGTTLDIFIDSNDPPTTVAEISALQIPTARGFVNLDTLATVSVEDGPATITTVKGQRSAAVTVTPNSEDLGSANAAVTQALDDLDLPAGATAELGGVSADQANAFSSLGIALLVAILVVYIIMVATFGSLLQPLLLLVSVPFAATGAIGLQVITGVPLGVPSFIGLLMLVGIVVTNAIVLIDLVNQYRAKGLAVREALIEGASRRLRPILMTALATIFALIPMAVGITGSGGFISQPLAIVVIGGLISSTLLTLVVLPVIYYLVEGGREKRKLKRQEKKAQQAGSAEESAHVSPESAKESAFDSPLFVPDEDGESDEPIRRRSTAIDPSDEK